MFSDTFANRWRRLGSHFGGGGAGINGIGMVLVNALCVLLFSVLMVNFLCVLL